MSNLLSASELYQGYYAIHKSLKDTQASLFSEVQSIKNLTNPENIVSDKFAELLKRLALKERQYELEYLNRWKIKIQEQYPESQTTHDLERFLTSDPPNISAAIQLVEMYSAKFAEKVFDEQKTFAQNLLKWQNMNKAYNNAFFKTAAKNSLATIEGNIGNMSVQDIIEKIIADTETEWDTKFSMSQSKKNFDQFMDTYAPALKSLVYEMNAFGGIIDKPLNSIKSYQGKTNKEILSSFAASVVEGLVNGFSQEEFQVVFGGGGGISTARHSSQLSYFSGKTQAVPTETDIYGAVTFELEPNKQILDAIASVNTHEAIKQKLAEVSPDNNFIIHYSSKDLSVAASSGSSLKAKIKGKGSFDSKIPALEELGAGMHCSEDVHNLIFQAINTGTGLMYENKGIHEITQALTALSIQFMFEDFGVELDGIINENLPTQNHLHIYFISGKYYAMSEILSIIHNQVLSATKTNSIVDIGFTPAKTDYYNKEVKNSNLMGVARWNAVRDKTISATQMQVILKVSKLMDLISFA